MNAIPKKSIPPRPNPWAVYEARKLVWLQQNPKATREAYDCFVMALVRELGI